MGIWKITGLSAECLVYHAISSVFDLVWLDSWSPHKHLCTLIYNVEVLIRFKNKTKRRTGDSGEREDADGLKDSVGICTIMIVNL